MKEFDLFGNERLPEKHYFLNSAETITESQLRTADHEIQVEAMRNWFHTHFEHPDESCPYDSEEGGYQWIYGGPYEPALVLQEEFDGIVDDETINILANKLSDVSFEWSGRSDLDDYLFTSVISSKYFDSFSEALTNIRFLGQMDVEAPQEAHFYRLLYLSVITALEAYLFESFTNTVLADKSLMRKFFEVHVSDKEKIPVNEVFKFVEKSDDDFMKRLANLVWHRLSAVQSMFANVLGVKFPISDKLDDAIRIRHDIVHRNGKTESGKERHITKETVMELAEEVEALVTDIDALLPQRKDDKGSEF